MNAKTALLTGIVVGVSLMVALLGFLAWRDHQENAADPAGDASVPAVDGAAVSR